MEQDYFELESTDRSLAPNGDFLLKNKTFKENDVQLESNLKSSPQDNQEQNFEPPLALPKILRKEETINLRLAKETRLALLIILEALKLIRSKK